jgi:hypothetical protein
LRQAVGFNIQLIFFSGGNIGKDKTIQHTEAVVYASL